MSSCLRHHGLNGCLYRLALPHLPIELDASDQLGKPLDVGGPGLQSAIEFAHTFFGQCELKLRGSRSR